MSGFRVDKLFYEQETCWTCGPACAKMFLKSIGINKKEKQLIPILATNKIAGTKNGGFYNFAKKYKFSYVIANDSSISDLKKLMKKKYFIIVSYYITSDKAHHYSVVKKIDSKKIYFLDPYFESNHFIVLKQFKKLWAVPAKYSKEKQWFIALKN